MEQKKQKRTKSAKLYLIAVFLICVVLIIIILQQKFNFNLNSLFSANQPDIKTNQIPDNKWAKSLELNGVTNLHKVSDDLYRGAQPSNEGMKQLEKLGIKTIINLRLVHSDQDEIKDTGLSYHHIHMTTLNPEKEDIVKFLKIATDSNNTPVFVHCQYGSDRTGTMCAIYRIAVQGWKKSEVIDEMTKGDFGFHTIWMNLVDYIQNLDIDEIKNAAGLSK